MPTTKTSKKATGYVVACNFHSTQLGKDFRINSKFECDDEELIKQYIAKGLIREATDQPRPTKRH